MSTEELSRTFLEGGSIAVDPADIERRLGELWRPAAEQVARKRGLPAVTRVSLGTQVVITSAARHREIGVLWNRLSATHPSRALLVVLDPAAEPGLTAEISALCHLPSPGQPQVCSERIQLRCRPDEARRIPGAVIPLLEAYVPATLWWYLPDVPPAALATRLSSSLDRCLTDLTYSDDAEATYRILRERACEPLSDLSWFRAVKWREAVAQLFDGVVRPETYGEIEAIEVVGAGASQGQLLPAALMAGWIAGQLGWTPLERQQLEPGVPGADYRTCSHTLWRRAEGIGEVRILLAPVGDQRPGRLQRVRLAGRGEVGWQVERLHDRPRELLIEAHHHDWCRIPSRLPAPQPDALEILRHALFARPANEVRDRAFRHAAWLLGWRTERGG